MLKRISFKMKLIVMTACSMVSFLVMSAMFAFAFSYIKDLNQGKELINRLDLKILELRKNENDFLTKKDLKYEKTFQNVYDEMTVLVAELSPLLNSLQIDAGQIKTYGSFLADYKNKFSQIVTLEQEIGLDENSGWQGDLSNNIHKIETILQQNYDYRLKYLILQLRKEEKDFLLQNNTEYLNNFNNTYNSFANHLAFNQTLNTSQKLEISGQLEKYKEGFQELIARYRKKGLTENEGLGGEMITLIHQAENLMRAIKSETESAIEQNESNLTRLTAAVLIILLLIILAVSILLITKITSAVGRFIYDLSSSADQLAAASDEISEGSQQLSQGATQQAASQQEMSSVMEQIAAQSKDTSNNAGNSAAIMKEIGEMATQSIRNAKNAADISDQARISAEKGTETMSKILSAMNDINETSNKASEIVEVITEITQQTKMLATNAAIEAARAGALGKGFAVVADEVSKLAENSKTAAKEVTILIKNSVQKTQIGNNYVEEGGMVLVNILENSIKVAKLVKEISDFSETQASKTNNAMQQVENIKSASNEQATAVDEVTRTLTELDKVTQANAANSEESASASVELASQADSLKDLVKEIATHFGIKTKSVTEHEKKELPQTFVTRKTELTSPLESKAEVIPLKSQKQLDNSINPTQAIPMRDDFKEF